MKKLLIILIGISLFSSIQAQNKEKTKDTTSVQIDFMGEKISISQKRIDSLANKILESFSAMLNDKDNQKAIKGSLEKMGTKMEKAIDILVEDKSQQEKIKTELRQSLKDIKPKLDTAIQSIQKNLDEKGK